MIKKIALYGKSGSGKDFVTENLCSDRGFIDSYRFAFADNVKRHIQILLGIAEMDFPRYLHDEDFKNHTLVDVSNMKINEYADIKHYNEHWAEVVTAKELDAMGLTFNELNERPIYMSLREFTVWYGTNVIQKVCGRKSWCSSLFNSKTYQFFSENRETLVIITDCRFPHEYEECRKRGFKFIKVEDPNNQHEEIKNIAESFYDTFEADFVFMNDKTDRDVFDRELSRLIHYIKTNS